MKRDDICKWMESVDNEYRAARFGLTHLCNEAQRDSRYLASAGLLLNDVRKCLINLEATYVVRLFAEFESALRIYWRGARKRGTSPQISKLITSIRASRDMPKTTVDCVHEVREFRNVLMHEKIQSSTLTLGDCRSYLAKFLSFLPPQW